MSTKFVTAFTLVVAVIAFTCGTVFQSLLGDRHVFAQEERYPSDVREQLKEGDVIIAIVPKLEESGIRIWVGSDSSPLGEKTDAADSANPKDIWTNVIVHDEDVLYFVPSMDQGLSLRFLGIKRSAGTRD